MKPQVKAEKNWFIWRIEYYAPTGKFYKQDRIYINRVRRRLRKQRLAAQARKQDYDNE